MLKVCITLEGNYTLNPNTGADGHDPNERTVESHYELILSENDFNGPSIGNLEEKYFKIIELCRSVMRSKVS